MMRHLPVNVFRVVLALSSAHLLVCCFDSEDVSLEHEVHPPSYDVEVMEGKLLQLKVSGEGPMCNPSWLHNGRAVSKTRCKVSYGELMCPAVSRSDAGRYDLWSGDGTAHGQNRLKFTAFVRVLQDTERVVLEPEARNAAPQEVEPIVHRYRERLWDDCFCSGVTGRCAMAPNLYRARITYNLSKAESVRKLLATFDAAPSNYLKIPGLVFGNLITAYGGYLRFPVTEECYADRSKPCIVVDHKRYTNRAIGFFLPRQHDQRQVQVLMTESSWSLLAPAQRNEYEDDPASPALSKFVFMSMLSNIDAMYIRGSYRTRGDGNQLSVDVASRHDGGLGVVTTVERCDCHEGYAGFSCERCDKNYLRTYESVNENGVCVSLAEVWESSKNKYGVNGREQFGRG
uniref:Laminin IV type A domain-containing protein n=1 Tax=Anopheles dirus TaxID=7168 RepID=A0A182MYB8_9DIPT